MMPFEVCVRAPIEIRLVKMGDCRPAETSDMSLCSTNIETNASG
jgi:hypothetical protein